MKVPADHETLYSPKSLLASGLLSEKGGASCCCCTLKTWDEETGLYPISSPLSWETGEVPLTRTFTLSYTEFCFMLEKIVLKPS